MRAIRVVATNTFRQTVRERLFYNVVIFGVGMVCLSMIVGQITFGYPDRVVRSIGLSGVSLALDLIALLLGVSLIYQEIDRKTLFVVLTRPIHRWQYVAGRYLGLIGTLTVALAGLCLVYAIALTVARGTIVVNDAYALLACLPEAAVLAGVGITLSAFTSPTIGAGIGLGLWIASATTDDLLNLTRENDELSRGLATAIYYVLPSLHRFNFRESAVYGIPIEFSHFASSCLYGAIFSLLLVMLSSLILSRREMV